MKQLWISGFAIASLSGCVMLEPQPPAWPYPDPPRGEEGATPVRTSMPAPESSAPAPSSEGELVADPAARSLVEQARGERDAGQFERAAASLERAMGIAPRDPVVWYELARLRFEQSNLVQAENLARRCLSFAGSRRDVRAAAWYLIADVKALQGDTAGQTEAMRQARAS